MNIFDSLKTKAFDVITRVMGYDAAWTSSESEVSLTAEIGFKDPSEKQELSGVGEFYPDQPFMEYRKGFFPGLKEAVDRGLTEFVLITQRNDPSSIVGYFAVAEVRTKYDGDTFVARLIKNDLP